MSPFASVKNKNLHKYLSRFLNDAANVLRHGLLLAEGLVDQLVTFVPISIEILSK